jgi:hypothetical protein
MDNNDSNPPAPKEAPVAHAEPKYIGNTNIIDRSAQAAPVSSQVLHDAPPASKPAHQGKNEQYQEASASLAEAIVVICGSMSSVAYLLCGYFFKSNWLPAVVAGLLAIVAVVFAFKQFNVRRQMTPLTVIGLSAATLTLVIIADFLILRELIKSAFNAVY